MTRVQTACYALIASAIVLTALLLVQSSQTLVQPAHAEMVVHKDFTTMLSTRYRADTDIVYVLDSKQARLLAYVLDPNKKTIELLGDMDVAKAFEVWAQNTGQGAGGVKRVPR
ncbi:MAG: hypothetical protein GC162_16040 [Planctomycetes bacterium]|nr:hypothetical protein [Planctomycetota bacterium]